MDVAAFVVAVLALGLSGYTWFHDRRRATTDARQQALLRVLAALRSGKNANKDPHAVAWIETHKAEYPETYKHMLTPHGRHASALKEINAALAAFE